MAESPRSWTESDLEALIGQTESLRREFKSGRLFENGKWIDAISREVSALANTEGGELFLGIAESRDKRPREASRIDGIPAALLPPERLQQIIEGNVSPYLPGIRVFYVRLLKQPDRVAFVVRVPQGSTAYQAKDHLYYSRSEFEAKSLPDHEIRLRMSRGKVARASLSANLLKTLLGADEEKRLNARQEALKKQHSNEFSALAEIDPDAAFSRYIERKIVWDAGDLGDKINFEFVLRNDGEISIGAPAIELQQVCSSRLVGLGWKAVKEPQRYNLKPGELIYPGDSRVIDRCFLECKRNESFDDGEYLVRWKIFLDNSLPSSGEIDLGQLFMSARTSGSFTTAPPA